ncbi:hypothetical protein JCM11641_008319 [Rhodosporidiobolus odoratus]
MQIHKSVHAVPRAPATSIFDFLLGPQSRALQGDVNKAALINGATGEKLSYADLKSTTLRLASGLSSLCSSYSTSTIFVLSRNCLLFPAIALAASASRLSASLADPSNTVYELVGLLQATKAGVLVIELGLLEKALKAADKADIARERIVVLPAAVGGKTLKAGEAKELGVKRIEDLMDGQKEFEPIKLTEEQAKEDISYFPRSGGLDGVLKLVKISPFNVVSHVLQCTTVPGFAVEGETKLTFLPQAYAIGLYLDTYLTLHLGGTLVFFPGFDFKAILDGIQKYQAKTFAVVPGLLSLLITSPLLDQYDLSSLRWIVIGGSAVPPPLEQGLIARLARLPHPPPLVVQAGGVGELTCVCWVPPMTAEGQRLQGKIGQLVPGLELKITKVGSEGKESVAEGEEGEAWLKGDSLSSGYLNDPKATAATFTQDGWFRSGDLVRLFPDGSFAFTGRTKPTIKNKGLAAFPDEIEQVIRATGLVEDCAVIGVWSKEAVSELPKAFIVSKSSSTHSAAELSKLIVTAVKRDLSPHKWLAGGVEMAETIVRRKNGTVDSSKMLTKGEEQIPRHEPVARL